MSNKLGPIVFISGSVNQDIYIKILCMDFKPFLDTLAANGVTNLEFKQDNTQLHKAKRTIDFL